MAMEEPATLRVVAAGEVVEAEWTPSGVPGLALVGRPVTAGWRLVHMATGRAVSRSAEHADPAAVRALARRIATLADWTDPNVGSSVPRLRQDLDKAMAAWRADHTPAPAPGETPASPLESEVPTELGRDLSKDLQSVASSVRAAEHERLLLRHIVRRLHDAAQGAFDEALATLTRVDREFIRSLVAGQDADEDAKDATAVVQAIRPTTDPRGVRAAAATRPAVGAPRPGGAGSRPGTTSPRSPARPRTPRFDGPDVAAS